MLVIKNPVVVKNQKEELLELINKYKGILNSSMFDYLNSVIELEFSILRDYISDTDREAIAELEIYKKAAIYNIQEKTKNLFLNYFQQTNYKHSIYDDKSLCVSVDINGNMIDVFCFEFERFGKIKIEPYNDDCDDIKDMRIGKISLFQLFENSERRDAELKRVKTVLKEINAPHTPSFADPRAIGSSETIEAFKRSIKKLQYQEKYRQLIEKNGLSEDEKKELEIKKEIHDMLFEEFGFVQDDFIDDSKSPFAFLDPAQTIMSKTLVKKMPHLIIKDKIKFI